MRPTPGSSVVPVLALVAAAACWGSVVVTIKIAARGLSVVALTAIELTAAALVLAVLAAASSVVRRRLPPRPSRAVLVGVLAAAGYVIVGSAVAARMEALDLTAYQFVVGWLVTAPLLLVLISREGSTASHPDTLSVTAAITTGVVGSVAAFLLYNWALTAVSTTLAGASLTLIPVFGLAMSVFALGDPISLPTLVAALAVVAGLLVIQRAEHAATCDAVRVAAEATSRTP